MARQLLKADAVVSVRGFSITPQPRPNPDHPKTQLEVPRRMVVTAFPLRPRKTFGSTTGESFLFRSMVLCLIVLCAPLITGCAAEGDAENGPIIGSLGASVSLAWNPVPNPTVTGYILYYGQQSPNSSRSCAYEQSVFISSPSVTVTGLAPNTTYFFAVSAYNGHHSPCSEEVSTVTPEGGFNGGPPGDGPIINPNQRGPVEDGPIIDPDRRGPPGDGPIIRSDLGNEPLTLPS
jgi:hypothetical protein